MRKIERTEQRVRLVRLADGTRGMTRRGRAEGVGIASGAWIRHLLAVALFPLLAVACHSGERQAAAQGGADGSGRIPCALAGAADFSPVCDVERGTDADGIVLTLHHPDGGFRRLRVMKDGRGVAAADGAVPARVSLTGDHQIQVALAGDRYLLPATVKHTAPAAP